MISHLGSPEQLVTLGNGAFLVARDQARLKALSSRLVGETGRSITPLPADLNDKADLAKVEAALRNDQAVTVLVNNAGMASVAPLLNADVEEMPRYRLGVTAST